MIRILGKAALGVILSPLHRAFGPYYSFYFHLKKDLRWQYEKDRECLSIGLEVIGEAGNQKYLGCSFFVWSFDVFAFARFLFPSEKVAPRHRRQISSQNWLNFF